MKFKALSKRRRSLSRARRVIAVVTMLAAAHGFGSFTAFAQAPDTTFDELRSHLEAGDRVTVTGDEQQPISGRLEALSPSSLRLLVDGRPRDIALREVLRVERRTRDSILNGVLIGAAIGAALFLKYYSENALCQGGCQFTSGALGMVGMGAGAGAGIDALIVRRETLFQRPPPAALLRRDDVGSAGLQWSISFPLTR
jgi:hypothetical protein